MEKILPPISSMDTMHQTSAARLNKVVYTSGFVTLALAVGSFPLFVSGLNLSSDAMKGLQMALFLVLGWLHATRMNYYRLGEGRDNSKLFFSLLLAFLILIALGVLFYVTRAGLVLMAVGAAGLFLLPFIISSAWQVFNDFSQIQYKIWSKPIDQTREKTFIFFSGIALKIKFSTEGTDRRKTLFRSLAPLDKTVGDFFNHFILIQRNNNKLNIELQDETLHPFGWKFYKVDVMGLRKTPLDPESTIKELELKNHDTILVKRVRLETPVDDDL